MRPEQDNKQKEDERPSGWTRRSAMRLLLLSGASLFAGSENSHAFMDFLAGLGTPSVSGVKGYGIPSDWLHQLGPQLPSYAAYLQRAGLRNISVRQLIEPHTHIRDGVHNTLPPRAMWGNIRSTLKVVDSLADRLDLPVKDVISVYRCPAYNARCPGAKSSSYHMRNNAMDVVFGCPPGKVAAMARAMRSSGLFKGGVGRYPGFTHIDTRGHNADW